MSLNGVTGGAAALILPDRAKTGAPEGTAPQPDAIPSRPSLFRSFFLGGFECSTHRRADGPARAPQRLV